MELAGATLPTANAPAGKVFSHWQDVATGQSFDSTTAISKKVTNVYAVYKDKPAQPAKPPVKPVKAKAPNTGDNSSIIYVAILTSSLLALIVAGKLRRRT